MLLVVAGAQHKIVALDLLADWVLKCVVLRPSLFVPCLIIEGPLSIAVCSQWLTSLVKDGSGVCRVVDIVIRDFGYLSW